MNALTTLQTLHDETHQNGFSHPTSWGAMKAAAEFIQHDLAHVVDAWHEREIELEAVKIENEQLLERLKFYERVAV